MKIHLIDTETSPSVGSIVRVNCGENVEFHPVDAEFDDERICQNCLVVHESLKKVSAKHTFALQNEKEAKRMKEIKRYGIYEFDGKENLIFVLKYRTWTKKKINALNSLILKYFLLDRIVYDAGPTGCIEIKRIYKRVKSISDIDVEKVAGHLHNLSRIFEALKFAIDKLLVQAPLV
jgi:hypothetical protein